MRLQQRMEKWIIIIINIIIIIIIVLHTLNQIWNFIVRCKSTEQNTKLRL